MSRLTKKIKGANYYCEFDLKNASYKQLFDLKSNKEIEDYVDCDLTIAIEKLQEQLGCPLEAVFKALENGFVCEKFVVEKDNYKDYPEKWEQWKKEDNNKLQHIGNTKYLSLEIWYKTIHFSAWNTFMEIWLEDYKKTWWLREDKSE